MEFLAVAGLIIILSIVCLGFLSFANFYFTFLICEPAGDLELRAELCAVDFLYTLVYFSICFINR